MAGKRGLRLFERLVPTDPGVGLKYLTPSPFRCNRDGHSTSHAAPPWQSKSRVQAVAALDGLRMDPSPLPRWRGYLTNDLSLLPWRRGRSDPDDQDIVICDPSWKAIYLRIHVIGIWIRDVRRLGQELTV